MLTFNFSRIFKARGVDKPFSYLVNIGYSGNFATRIVNSRIASLNLKAVERLCELLQCTPNDLLVWTPEKKDAKNETHPLISLKRNETVVNLTRILNSVPLNKLNEIEKMINDKIKE
ncbi:MAG: helix-turn-helix transcriptional regulator [bacterium]|nr:helix-turn-helix transcriptional regulator [bacterium]